MVKVLVGQGAGVEKRNGSGLSAYDVATDHVIRQFLLPLQLKVRTLRTSLSDFKLRTGLLGAIRLFLRRFVMSKGL